jgi:hypothetical protein
VKLVCCRRSFYVLISEPSVLPVESRKKRRRSKLEERVEGSSLQQNAIVFWSQGAAFKASIYMVWIFVRVIYYLAIELNLVCILNFLLIDARK